MTQHPQGEPFHESNLNSPEYRERLMRKLNCLIAVLEVATAKVKKSLAQPAADTERLTRIRSNLQSTLDVCLRARAALERREALPKELPENLSQVIEDAGALGGDRSGQRKLPRRARMEFDHPDTRRRFAILPAIDKSDLERVDLDELVRRLQGG